MELTTLRFRESIVNFGKWFLCFFSPTKDLCEKNPVLMRNELKKLNNKKGRIGE